jgi:hypothetical protein
MSETDKGEVRRRAISLSVRQRWASGLVGAGAGGSGAVATFITSNQAGATALMLGGGLGLLMSLTGRVPDRIGREGVVHEAVDEAPARALERALTGTELDPDDQLKIAEIFQEEAATVDKAHHWTSRMEVSLDSPPVTGISVRDASEGLIYGNAVKEALRTVLPVGARLRERHGGDLLVYAVIDRQDGSWAEPDESVAVEVRVRPTRGGVRELTDRLAAIYKHALIVVPRGRAPQAVNLPDNVQVVEFGAFGDNGAFGVERRDRAALQDAVTEAWSKLSPATEVVTPEPEVVPWERGPDVEGQGSAE